MTAWILTDGKIGDRVQCQGIVDQLIHSGQNALRVEEKTISPSKAAEVLLLLGLLPPHHRPAHKTSPIAPPYPDLIIASGRRTVPYLKTIKKASNMRTFTVFLKDPRTKTSGLDLIWVPWHDKLRGENVLVTLTAPHTITTETLKKLQNIPLPGPMQNMPAPRIGLIIGDPLSRTRSQSAAITTFLKQIDALKEKGASLNVVSSRRTPNALITALKQHLASTPHWIWDSETSHEENPYKSILATSDILAVTADSHNMVGEALATGTPVYPIIPHALNPKLARFITELKTKGYLLELDQTPPKTTYTPLDATKEIAAIINKKMEAHRKRPHL